MFCREKGWCSNLLLVAREGPLRLNPAPIAQNDIKGRGFIFIVYKFFSSLVLYLVASPSGRLVLLYKKTSSDMITSKCDVQVRKHCYTGCLEMWESTCFLRSALPRPYNSAPSRRQPQLVG
ncbi:hypothetical protein GQ53DRAFT_15073 [Thozetella sp. PMI_491]|nr:hypothetical protein GQ53DRAFT_15073 [Thozetella sp. PMI_491]